MTTRDSERIKASSDILPVNYCLWSERWPVFYLDNHVLAIYKPAGVTVQGARPNEPSLITIAKLWLKEVFHKPGNVYLGTVHRLDKPVAGVCLFGRTSKGASRLSAQFREREVTKEYLAIVEGIPKPDRSILRGLIVRDDDATKSRAGSSKGREAVLEYEVLDTWKGQALLKVLPVTGRRHQIRAQLAGHGHPVLGDVRYGARVSLPNGAIALLAKSITFSHPTRGESITITCSEPEGWPWHRRVSAETNAEVNPPWTWLEFARLLPTIVIRKALPGISSS